MESKEYMRMKEESKINKMILLPKGASRRNIRLQEIKLHDPFEIQV